MHSAAALLFPLLTASISLSQVAGLSAVAFLSHKAITSSRHLSKSLAYSAAQGTSIRKHHLMVEKLLLLL